MDATNGLAQIGLGLLQCNLCVRWINLDDRFALFHDLRIVRIDRDDCARDLGRDLYDVTVDVRIVGIHVVTGVKEIKGAIRSACDPEGSDKQRKQQFAFSGFLRRFVDRR
jgi:hypothetical protein